MLPWRLDALAPDGELDALPSGHGVACFEDDAGRTVALVAGANLRELVRRRLAPDETAEGGARVDYRALTRVVRVAPAGSSFEADWAALELSRERLPALHEMLARRWRPWFVHCDPRAEHPRWTKSDAPAAGAGAWFGPIADKHAAARYIDLLIDAFDLCRYHHVLVQAPHGDACAYKQMGRCPAPCDGSVPMARYTAQVEASLRFAGGGAASVRGELEAQMAGAAERLEFETAERCRRVLAATAPATRRPLARVDRFERFRFVAVQPAEHRRTARLFTIHGNEIALIGDLPASDRPGVQRAAEEVLALAGPLRRRALTPGGETDRLGLVTHYLLGPPKRRGRGSFLRIDDELEAKAIEKAIRRAAGEA